MTPRERVLAHLATCAKCKAEADAQRRLKNVFARDGPADRPPRASWPVSRGCPGEVTPTAAATPRRGGFDGGSFPAAAVFGPGAGPASGRGSTLRLRPGRRALRRAPGPLRAGASVSMTSAGTTPTGRPGAACGSRSPPPARCRWPRSRSAGVTVLPATRRPTRRGAGSGQQCDADASPARSATAPASASTGSRPTPPAAAAHRRSSVRARTAVRRRRPDQTPAAATRRSPPSGRRSCCAVTLPCAGQPAAEVAEVSVRSADPRRSWPPPPTLPPDQLDPRPLTRARRSPDAPRPRPTPMRRPGPADAHPLPSSSPERGPPAASGVDRAAAREPG